MPDTLIRCKCCEDPHPTSAMKYDDDLQGHVCNECRRFLYVAVSALWDQRIRNVALGPYSGNSNG